MREISPAKNMSAEEFLSHAPKQWQEATQRLREEKRRGTRPRPSAALLDDLATVLTPDVRRALIDHIAALVDENLFGRGEMCMQFAELLHLSLGRLKFPSRVVLGTALYFHEGREAHRWGHAWVRVGAEVIDANVDSLSENPFVPPTVRPRPYWGPIDQTPQDRRLIPNLTAALNPDDDVASIWWPELLEWIDRDLLKIAAADPPASPASA